MISPEWLMVIGVVIGSVGLVQGNIVGSHVKKKFPKGKVVGEFFSLVLFGLYLLYVIVNINEIYSIIVPTNYGDFLKQFNFEGISNSIIPHDTYGWLSLLLPLMIFFIGYGAKIKGWQMKFVTFVSISALIFTGSVKFAGIDPTPVGVQLYTVYQIGILIGFLFGSNAFTHIKRRTKHIHFPTHY